MPSLAKSCRNLLPPFLAIALALPAPGGAQDYKALEEQHRCTAALTPDADARSAGAAAEAFLDAGYNDPAASMAAEATFHSATGKLVEFCAQRYGWPAAIQREAEAQIWYLILEGKMEQALAGSGLDPDRLAKIGEGLPPADLTPFFDPFTPLSDAARESLRGKMIRASLAPTDESIYRAAADYLYLRGARTTMDQRLRSALLSGWYAGSSYDPRDCLFRQGSPQDNAALYDAIANNIEEKNNATFGRIEADLGPKAINRCFASQGWIIAARETVKDLLYSDGRAMALRPTVIALGIEPAAIDAELAGRSEDELHTIYWDTVGDKDPLDPAISKVAEGRLGRKLSVTEQATLKDYVHHQGNTVRMLKIFARIHADPGHPILSERWQLLPAIDANQPVIVPRELTKAERSEIRKLASAYADVYKGRTAETLQKLSQLASSGDHDAMLAIRNALMKGPPRDIENYQNGINIYTDELRDLTKVMAAQWTARIWDRFGYEDAGRAAMEACVEGIFGKVYYDKKMGVNAYLQNGTIQPSNYNGDLINSSAETCGFTLQGAPAYSRENGKLVSIAPKGAVILKYFDYKRPQGSDGNRAQELDYYVTGVTFNPILGDGPAMAAKFENHLIERASGKYLEYETGETAGQTLASGIALAWYEQYARETGQEAYLQTADLGRRQELEAAAAARLDRARADYAARAEQFNEVAEQLKAAPYSLDLQNRLASLAGQLGGQYWEQYRQLVPETYFASGSTGGNSGGGYSWSNPSAQVEVRNYDSSGTYTGSTTTSAVWADIMKMGSSAPR